LPVIPYDYRDTPKRWSTKISGCSSTAIATACPTAMSAAGSPSRPTPVRSPSTIAWKRSSAMRVRGGAARPSAPNASSELAESGPRPGVRRRSSDCSIRSTACVRAALEAYLRDMADTDRSLGRQISELLELIRQYGPECGRRHRESRRGSRFRRRLRRQHPAPAAIAHAGRNRRFAARSALERTRHRPVSLLEYDAFILESGKESDDSPRTETPATESESDEPKTGDDDLLKPPPRISASAATLEWLADMELEARTAAPSNAASNARAYRRSPASTPSLPPSQEPLQAKNRILRCSI
jgi:hypothetical protein